MTSSLDEILRHSSPPVVDDSEALGDAVHALLTDIAARPRRTRRSARPRSLIVVSVVLAGVLCGFAAVLAGGRLPVPESVAACTPTFQVATAGQSPTQRRPPSDRDVDGAAARYLAHLDVAALESSETYKQTVAEVRARRSPSRTSETSAEETALLTLVRADTARFLRSQGFTAASTTVVAKKICS
jgi:hypothetical protein